MSKAELETAAIAADHVLGNSIQESSSGRPDEWSSECWKVIGRRLQAFKQGALVTDDDGDEDVNSY